LCPDDLGAFLNQQYRWCNGSITLLNSGDAHTKPLGIRQRLCFWAGFMYYITTAINVFTIHLPGLVMAAFYPEEIRPAHYVPFLVGAWVYLVLLPRVFTTRWRFEVLRVQMAYSFSHAVAIFDKLTRRSAGWVPTGAVKTGNRLSRRIGRTAYYWLILSTASSWVFLTIDIARFGPGNFWTAVLFLGAYTYLAVPLVRDLHRLLARERTLAREALAATAPKHTAPVKTRPARPTRLAAVTRSAER
jgi:cellulose synthase (UDP-forming)